MSAPFANLAVIVRFVCLIGLGLTPAYGQTPPTNEQFRDALTNCSNQERIAVRAETMEALYKIYADEITRTAFADPKLLLVLLPEQDRVQTYRLYVQCIAKVLPQQQSQILPQPQPQPTVQYKVCTGEYERACQQHDAYLYCYADVAAWARARCTSFSITRLNTYGGNRCGYSIDSILCTGPK